MLREFEVISIPSSNYKFNKQLNGILPKGWVEIPDGRALFKQAVQDSSEIPESRTDWSEKIVSELSNLIQLPAAQYELAQIVDGTTLIPGSISLNLTQDEDRRRFPLSEILLDSVSGYDYAFDYEVSNVIQALTDNKIRNRPSL